MTTKRHVRVFGWITNSTCYRRRCRGSGFPFFPDTHSANSDTNLRAPPELTPAEFEEYMTLRDPIRRMDRPAYKTRTEWRTADGARISPANAAASAIANLAFPSTATRSLLDTTSSNDEAWPNVLAERMSCPVQNFGVGGYGVDQAALRFVQNDTDMAPISILGIFTDDLNRNMNQWRYLLRAPKPLRFKPSFQLDENGGIEIVPLPVSSYGDLLDIYRMAGSASFERKLSSRRFFVVHIQIENRVSLRHFCCRDGYTTDPLQVSITQLLVVQ